MEDALNSARLLNEKIIQRLYPIMLHYRDAFTRLFLQEKWEYPNFNLWCDELFFHIKYFEKVYHRGSPSWESILNEDCREMIRVYHSAATDFDVYRYLYKVLTIPDFEDELGFRDPIFMLECIQNVNDTTIADIIESHDASLTHMKAIIDYSKHHPGLLYKLELRGF